MIFLHPRVHLAYFSSMVEKPEGGVGLMDHFQAHPEEIHLMEGNGQMFFLLLMSCEYHANMHKNSFFFFIFSALLHQLLGAV